MGADVDARDHAGWTPLHEACNHGKYSAARVLVAAGADVNAAGGDDDDTPLHDAASGGNERLVLLLLRAGAASDRPNRRGARPIDQCDTNERCRQLLSGNVPLVPIDDIVAGDDASQAETDSADEVTSSVDHPISSEAASPSAAPRAPVPTRVLSPLVAPDRRKQDNLAEVVTKSFASGQSISHQSLLDIATQRIHDSYITKPQSPVTSQKIVAKRVTSTSIKADDSVEEGEIREDTPLRAADESTGNLEQQADSANMTVIEETDPQSLKPQSAADTTDVLRHRRGRGRPPSTARKQHNTVSNAALMKRQSLQLHRHRAAAALSHDKDRTTPVRPNTNRADGPASVAGVADNDDVYDFHDEGESNNLSLPTTSIVKLPTATDGDAKTGDNEMEQQSEVAVQPIEREHQPDSQLTIVEQPLTIAQLPVSVAINPRKRRLLFECNVAISTRENWNLNMSTDSSNPTAAAKIGGAAADSSDVQSEPERSVHTSADGHEVEQTGGRDLSETRSLRNEPSIDSLIRIIHIVQNMNSMRSFPKRP
jgi:hypothetical protein